MLVRLDKGLEPVVQGKIRSDRLGEHLPHLLLPARIHQRAVCQQSLLDLLAQVAQYSGVLRLGRTLWGEEIGRLECPEACHEIIEATERLDAGKLVVAHLGRRDIDRRQPLHREQAEADRAGEDDRESRDDFGSDAEVIENLVHRDVAPLGGIARGEDLDSMSGCE
ncbi:Exonuclease SbcC (plasmid) [Rhodovastum atsumiense]|nr:Exonuclease SbcC [Rhodovastum atsumiense]